MPMLRMVRAQSPANRMDANRQVIHSGVALEAPATRPSRRQMPTAMSVTMAQIAPSWRATQPCLKLSHPTIRTTGSTLSAILDVMLERTPELKGSKGE